MNSLGRSIEIETHGLLENLVKALDCFTFRARTMMSISVDLAFGMFKNIGYNDDGQIVTNLTDQGIVRITTYSSSIDMDKLKESGLEWHYKKEDQA